MASAVLNAVREDSAASSSSSSSSISGARAGGPRPAGLQPCPEARVCGGVRYENACENGEGSAFLRSEGVYSSQIIGLQKTKTLFKRCAIVRRAGFRWFVGPNRFAHALV